MGLVTSTLCVWDTIEHIQQNECKSPSTFFNDLEAQNFGGGVFHNLGMIN